MKAVVLLSGGIDSTTCLAEAVEAFGAEEVTALTMFYGQKHDRELESAKAVAVYYGVNHVVRDLASVFEFDNNPLLAKSTKEMPLGSYAEQKRDTDGMSKTYVPFRNGLFLSYATAIAYSLGADLIYYGAHADDAAGNAYPDCTPEFYEGMNEAINQGTGKKVKLYAPLLHLNKAEIVEAGIEIGAPYAMTWSCYEGRQLACGKCGTCVDRVAAFHANAATDPIPYEA
jgi:7-cyano-7-deazaguanine synthase